MRTYEALYIVVPDLEDDAIQTVVKGVDDLVTNNGGTIVRSEIWGKRKLAYPVKKHTEGSYVLLRFQAAPEFITRIENHFKLSEAIIRYLTVHFDEHTLRLEAEQNQRKEDELRSGGSGGRGRRGDRQDDATDPIPVAAGAPAGSGDDEKETE